MAFGQGCHFWVDRVSRIAGLIIGAIQLCRYLLTTRISKTKTTKMSEKRSLWLRTCDHITAVLLIMETIHVVTRWRSEAYEKAQKLRPADEPSGGGNFSPRRLRPLVRYADYASMWIRFGMADHPRAKFANGLRVAVGRYRNEVALVAHVNAGGVPMDDVQARIV